MSEAIRASLVSVGCFLRAVPLFFCAAPRTPLRVLGIIALDTLHVLRHSQPMPRNRIRELAMFMDFEGWTNAVWDEKNLCATEYEAVRQRLTQAGLGSCVEAYLGRLRALESGRPAGGGDHWRFEEVRRYREAVIRLSLGTVLAIALKAESLDEGIRSIHRDDDAGTLFQIAMQCQVIDDVLDHAEDLSAGLPSFLTASASLPQAMALTARAARSYAAPRRGSSCPAVFPLRLALGVVTAVTRFILHTKILAVMMTNRMQVASEPNEN